MSRFRALALALVLVPLSTAQALGPLGAMPGAVPEAGPDGPREHAGTWATIPGVPSNVVHAAQLPTGKLMVWGYSTGRSYLWDPATGQFSGNVPMHQNSFCAGMALTRDGDVLAVGGTQSYDPVNDWLGLKAADRFDSEDEVWVRQPDMAAPRWYPTAVTLGTGEVAVFTGIHNRVINSRVEVYDPDTQSWAQRGSKSLPLYARGHLMPDGRVLFTSPGQPTAWDPATGGFANLASRVGGWRGGGSSVMLDGATGAMLVLGGSGTPATSEVYDPAAQRWKASGTMARDRVWADATVLPNGDVLVVGGELDLSKPPYPAEYWEASTGQWVQVATPRWHRAYHSSGLLMPDGSVVEVGETATMERYRPWYMFVPDRPRIQDPLNAVPAVPDVVAYGTALPILTPDADTVAQVVLMRLGATTHSLNTDARRVPLDWLWVPGDAAVVALAPDDPDVAPPGYYMVFLVDGRGVPSEARIVQLLEPEDLVPPDLAPPLP